MGIQNFIDGGFIGKVGDVVGQRWKDKKMVRAYVKGKQPNTPAQINVRDMFRQANQLAQEAMNINGHTGVWDASKTPEYSQRVGLAFKRLKAGMSPSEALPLYPEGYNPAQPISISDWTYNQEQDIITIITSDFGAVIPERAVLKMFSPIYMSGTTFNEIQVNAGCSDTSIYFSASQNQQALTALQLGIVAIYGTFYDQDGTELTQTVIETGYAIQNKLYYFSEQIPIQTINPDTYIRRAVTDGQSICRRTLDTSTQDYNAVALYGNAVMAGGGDNVQILASATTISGGGISDIPVNIGVQSGSIDSYTVSSFFVKSNGNESYLASAADTANMTANVSITSISYVSGTKVLTVKFSGDISKLAASGTVTAKTCNAYSTATTETHNGALTITGNTAVISGWGNIADFYLSTLQWVALMASTIDQFGSSDTGITFNMDYWQDDGFKTWDFSINPTAEYFENYWDVNQSAGTVTWTCEGPINTQNPYWGYAVVTGAEQPSGESIYIDTALQNVSFPWEYETDLSDPSDEEAETESVEMQVMSKSDANRHPIIYVLARSA